jgi:hypothetical protein
VLSLLKLQKMSQLKWFAWLEQLPLSAFKSTSSSCSTVGMQERPQSSVRQLASGDGIQLPEFGRVL